MKLKKTFVIFSILIAFVLILIIYSAKSLSNYPNRKASIIQDYQEVCSFQNQSNLVLKIAFFRTNGFTLKID